MENEFGRIIAEAENNRLISPSQINEFLFKYQDVLSQPEAMQMLLDEVDDEIEYYKQMISSRTCQLEALKSLMAIKKMLANRQGGINNVALITIVNPQ